MHTLLPSSPNVPKAHKSPCTERRYWSRIDILLSACLSCIGGLQAGILPQISGIPDNIPGRPHQPSPNNNLPSSQRNLHYSPRTQNSTTYIFQSTGHTTYKNQTQASTAHSPPETNDTSIVSTPSHPNPIFYTPCPLSHNPCPITRILLHLTQTLCSRPYIRPSRYTTYIDQKQEYRKPSLPALSTSQSITSISVTPNPITCIPNQMDPPHQQTHIPPHQAYIPYSNQYSGQNDHNVCSYQRQEHKLHRR